VSFTPPKNGPAEDRWLITADDGQGAQEVALRGTGGDQSSAGGCSSPGTALAWWPSILLVPWLLRRRRAQRSTPMA